MPDEPAILVQFSNAFIHANHKDMARFSSEADSGYLIVCGLLKDWMGALENQGHREDQEMRIDSAQQASGTIPIDTAAMNEKSN